MAQATYLELEAMIAFDPPSHAHYSSQKLWDKFNQKVHYTTSYMNSPPSKLYGYKKPKYSPTSITPNINEITPKTFC